jgi:hypothetical protein
MRYIIALILAVAIIGCQKPKPETHTIVVETPKESQPPVVQVLPSKPLPTPPSAIYLEGYNDGYYANWLAPIRYAFSNEYRAGRSAGLKDRQASLPHRFKGN